MNDRVYLDHNATSPLRPEVRAFWLEALDALPANASSLHAEGRRARQLVDEARERVAAALGVHEEAVHFTSGGTEANNLALLGATRPGDALVTTGVEHPSVLGPAGRRRHVVAPVDASGRVDPVALVDLARHEAARLVSLQAANNEVGTLQPVQAVAEGLASLEARADTMRPLLHVDAVQALGRLPLTLDGVDLVSLSTHKVGGPQGCGVLLRARGARVDPRTFGGGQENGLRPGTEAAATIAAGALAIELAAREALDFERRVRPLARALWATLSERNPELVRFGADLEDAHRSLPNTLSIAHPDFEARMLVARLDGEGVAVGAGSACSSGALEPSHVLLAMGHDERTARAGLRISLGWNTTEADCKRAAAVLGAIFSSSPATHDKCGDL